MPEEVDRVLNLDALAEILASKQPTSETKGSMQEDVADDICVDGVGWLKHDKVERLKDVWGIDLARLVNHVSPGAVRA